MCFEDSAAIVVRALFAGGRKPRPVRYASNLIVLPRNAQYSPRHFGVNRPDPNDFSDGRLFDGRVHPADGTIIVCAAKFPPLGRRRRAATVRANVFGPRVVGRVVLGDLVRPVRQVFGIVLVDRRRRVVLRVAVGIPFAVGPRVRTLGRPPCRSRTLSFCRPRAVRPATSFQAVCRRHRFSVCFRQQINSLSPKRTRTTVCVQISMLFGRHHEQY